MPSAECCTPTLNPQGPGCGVYSFLLYSVLCCCCCSSELSLENNAEGSSSLLLDSVPESSEVLRSEATRLPYDESFNLHPSPERSGKTRLLVRFRTVMY